MNQKNQTAQTASSNGHIWCGTPIDVIGLCGEYQSGKSMFGLWISPKDKKTKVYDFEKSVGTYENLIDANNNRVFDFVRIDVPSVMHSLHPSGYDQAQLFKWWLDDVRATPSGAYDVIVVDTVSDIEAGLIEYVKKNCREFGLTPSQVEKGGGLIWGAVKKFWKQILVDLSSRCQSFVFTAHMGAKWQGERPVPGVRKPKGLETLQELASLYLKLERVPDAKGRMPRSPVGHVIKSRLGFGRINAAGDIELQPSLPPRIDPCTPQAIRDYILSPYDPNKPKSSELAVIEQLSDEDKMLLDAQIAADKKDAEQAALARAELIREEHEKDRQMKASAAPYFPPVTPNSQPKQDPPAQPSPECQAMINKILDACRQLNLSQAAAETSARNRGAVSLAAASLDVLNSMYSSLSAKLDGAQMERDLAKKKQLDEIPY